VNHIEYTNDTVTLTTEDGSTYTSNFVILSVSLGVLKSDLITYTPDLPVSSHSKYLDYTYVRINTYINT
jgi:polyamine oxidase